MLPDIVIDTIMEYGGRGINFCCTCCRLKGASGSNGSQSGSVIDGLEVWMVVSVSRQ